jgi:drug/metabolite transporter (DMT)-like permease
MMLTVIAYGLSTAILWGISGFLQGKITQQRAFNPLACAFVANAVGTLAYTALYFTALRGPSPHLTGVSIGYAAVGGAVITFGSIAFFHGLSIGPVSLVSPLSSTYPVVTLILALSLFGAHLNARQLGGIVVVIAGILAATGLFQQPAIPARQPPTPEHPYRGPALGLVTAVCWGTGFPLVGRAIAQLGWQTATLIEFIAIVAAFLMILAATPAGRTAATTIPRVITNAPFVLSSFIQLAGALTLNLGLQAEHASGAIVAALSACYPVLTVVLALRHLHEHITRLQIIGALLSVCGGIVLALS